VISLAVIDDYSFGAFHRYNDLIAAIEDHHARTIMFEDPQMPVVHRAYRQRRSDLVNNWISEEDRKITERVTEVAFFSVTDARVDLDALGDTWPSLDALGEHLDSVEQHLQGETRAQLTRDLLSFDQRIRSFLMETSTLIQAQGLSRENALVRRRIQETKKVEQTKFQDRAGRTYGAGKFIRGTWRQTLIWLHNDLYLNEAARLGATGAIVTVPDKNKEVEIKFVPGYGAPTYEEIRDEYFHPNSVARLVAKK
jgi:hypothetical protein